MVVSRGRGGMNGLDNGKYGGNYSHAVDGVSTLDERMNDYMMALHTLALDDDHNVHNNHVGHST